MISANDLRELQSAIINRIDDPIETKLNDIQENLLRINNPKTRKFRYFCDNVTKEELDTIIFTLENEFGYKVELIDLSYCNCNYIELSW